LRYRNYPHWTIEPCAPSYSNGASFGGMPYSISAYIAKENDPTLRIERSAQGKALGYFIQSGQFIFRYTNTQDGFEQYQYENFGTTIALLQLPGWLIALTGVIICLPSGTILIRRCRCAMLIATMQCLHCHYDLRGSGQSENCPECGTLIGQATKDAIAARVHTPSMTGPPAGPA
jgi:hypothetical protein